MAESGWPRPTLAAIMSRTRSYITATVEGSELSLRRHVIRYVSDAVSMGIHTLHGFVEYLTRQILVVTADEDNLPRHAQIWGISRLDAAPSVGTWLFTGTPSTAIPAGTQFARADGVTYETDALATIGGGGSVTVACTAVEPGADGNCDVNTAATLVSPISGVNSAVTAYIGGSTGGTDVEELEDWRARILFRIRNPPQGGAETDYIQWAKATTGVDRAWVLANWDGAGTVGVWFTVEGADPVPSAPQVAAVQAYIDARRPVNAQVTVAAPSAVEVDFTIEVSPDTAAIRLAIEAELAAHLLGFVGGETVQISPLSAAISQAEGEDHHTMSDPSMPVVLAINEVPVLGTITWS